MTRESENLKAHEWHLVTCEYPPQVGGVADYTRLLAEALAATGDEVHVWTSRADACEDSSDASRVHLHRTLGDFGPRAWARLGRALDARGARRRLLVQYVPHGYGWRAMNLWLCAWLLVRGRVRGERVEIVVHEPFLELHGGTWKQKGVALVQRLMTALLLGAASRVWVVIPAWERLWRPFAFGRSVRFSWLPVPCVVPPSNEPARVAALRAEFKRDGDALVGHLGTYPRHVCAQLSDALVQLLNARQGTAALLLGRGSERVRDEIIRRAPQLRARLHATGTLSARELSCHLAACDLLVQPFPDGVSSRRTSVMAGLSHGLPVVTTSGRLTEPLWAGGGAVRLVAADDTRALVEATTELLEDADARTRLATAGRAFYEAHFNISHVVNALRRGDTKRAEDEAAREGLEVLPRRA